MDKEKADAREEDSSLDRRGFMKGAAAAGLLGAMALTPGLTEQAAAVQAGGPARAPRNPAQEGPRKPSLDMRDPVYFAGIADGARVIMDHFKALGQRDIKGVADTLHFPFASIEQTDVAVVNTPEDLMAKAPASLNMNEDPERFTDHDGYINPGSYDVFSGFEAFNSDPVQLNFAMSYDRYSSSGNLLLHCDGVYAVTNNDGRWAIQAMSTIFTPGTQVGMEFPDSVLAAHRLRETHTQGYQMAYLPNVWANTRQLGPTVSIDVRKDDDFGFAQAPKFKNGVKNRLRIADNTQDKLDAIKIDFPRARSRWREMGMGSWGFDWGGGRPWRVIHQGVNKVHMYQGTTRFTAGGEYMSNQAEIDVMTLVGHPGGPNGEPGGGRWGWAGLFGYAIRHDRTRDIKNIDSVRGFSRG